MLRASSAVLLSKLAENSSRVAKLEKQYDDKHSLLTSPKSLLLTGKDIIDIWDKKFKEQKIELSQIQEDAEQIFKLLTPRITVWRDPKTKQYIQTPLTSEAEWSSISADIVMCFGNNDLHHLKYAAKYWHHFQKSNHAPRKIIVTGKGGHGTVPGVIFGLTEAVTMKRRLVELGVPDDKILVEPNSTHTGENISFTDQMIPPQAQHLAFTTTISTGFRQLSSIFHQSKHQWKSVSILAPSWNEAKTIYFSNRNEALINFIYMLREVATFLDYMIFSEKLMCPRLLPDVESLTTAVHLLIKYFNLVAGNIEEASNITKKVILALAQKSQGSLHSVLKASLQPIIFELSHYFRCTFNLVEKQSIKTLSPTSLVQQSELIDYQRTYARFHLDSPRASQKPIKPASDVANLTVGLRKI